MIFFHIKIYERRKKAMSKLENLEPERVFHFFEEIASIPHGSYHTKSISNYLADFAKSRGLEYYQDDTDNVVIIKEAAEGYGDLEPVILQGHMDMVCEKESGCEIDFLNDGLDLYVEGDFLKARGTTLGGDDGIALAYALAILDSQDLKHPRIEAVFTTNEEVGLLGAKDIDLSMLKGRILLNIDSDVEGHFLTSCAGGLSAHSHIPVEYHTLQGVGISIKLFGLSGGHSGGEIHKEHCNAAIAMGRILKEIEENCPVGLCELSGGLKDNAIPREGEALIAVPGEAKDTVLSVLHTVEGILKKEYDVSEPKLALLVQVLDTKEYSVLKPASMQRVLFYLRNVPDGVMHKSMHIENLVETSLNLGIMELKEEEFYTCTSVRSSVGTRKEELAKRLCYLVEFLGGEFEIEGDYPAWEYRSESKLREKISRVYREMYGKKPVFEAIHAGLECGILSEKIPDLDAVSFGPDNFDIHTPKERLSISSTKRVWEFLTGFLEKAR